MSVTNITIEKRSMIINLSWIIGNWRPEPRNIITDQIDLVRKPSVKVRPSPPPPPTQTSSSWFSALDSKQFPDFSAALN